MVVIGFESDMKTGIAYFGVRNPKWVREDMKVIREAGFSHVLHTWSEEDEQYYKDTMAEIVEVSVQEGLKVYVNPWGIGRVFGGEAYSELVSRTPSMAQIAFDGKVLPAACPNHPEFQKYLFEWIHSVCKTSVETVFWDEPHFYFEKSALERFACRCETCKNLFESKYHFPMPSILTPEVKNFREQSLISFLESVTAEVHRYGKRNSVCLLPPWFPAGLDAWEDVAKIQSVDEIGSDPYWEKTTSTEEIKKNYAEVSTKIKTLTDIYQKENQMWIKNYHIVAGKESDVEIATQESFNAGIRNIFAWSYLGSEYLSWLRSDHPKKVWETQVRAFAKCIAAGN